MKRILAALLFVLQLPGCETKSTPTHSDQVERAPVAEEAPAPAVPAPEKMALRDQEPSGFAERVRRAHTAADAARTDEDRRAASKQLLLVLEGARGSEVPSEVRDDLAGRAALLRLQAGDPGEARAVVARTLGNETGPSVARANLLVVAADVEERLGNAQEARRYLMDALAMNQVLLAKELENP